MTDIYSTVLDEETNVLPPAGSAQRWYNTLLTQLELDGFGSGVGASTGSSSNTPQLAFSART